MSLSIRGGFTMEVKQPASALSSPRFCNMGTFMRMPRLDSAKGLDLPLQELHLILLVHFVQVHVLVLLLSAVSQQ